MGTPLKDRDDLLRLALDTQRDQYGELSDTWRNIDTKAQGAGAIAGVFLAALFAWIRDLPATFTAGQRWLLVGGIVLPVLSAVFALLALRIRTVSAPPLGDETQEMVDDLLNPAKIQELPERLPGFAYDQIRAWRATNSDMHRQNLRKARWVQAAQWLLFVTAAVVAALAVIAALS